MNLAEKEINFSPELNIIFIQIEKHRFDLMVIEGEHLVKPLYAVERPDSYLVDLVI